mgnify:FL=1
MDVVVVTPVLDDWDSLAMWIDDLRCITTPSSTTTVVVVDDGSIQKIPPELLAQARSRGSCHVLQLKTNVGHQRAIAIGLAYVADAVHADWVAVMDADGEDPPSALASLLRTAEQNPDAIILATRGKRHEGWRFQTGYVAYRLAVRVGTGLHLNHGNFCVLPAHVVPRIVSMESVWNHFGATIELARDKKISVRVDRGHRYRGTSRMNTIALVNHGLAAMAALADRLFVRMLGLAAAALTMAMFALFFVVTVRTFTQSAIPGWATAAAGLAAVAALQAFTLVATTTFAVLMERRAIDPPLDTVFRQFIASIDKTS